MTASVETLRLVSVAADAAAEKKATDIVAFDVSDQLAIADVFLVCSGANERQVEAIVEAVEERLRAKGERPTRREGEREARWVLLDYLDLVVHVQHREEREFYGLQRLWRDCPLVPLPETARVQP